MLFLPPYLMNIKFQKSINYINEPSILEAGEFVGFLKDEKGHFSVEHALTTAAVSALVLAATAFVVSRGEKLQAILQVINQALR